MTNITYTTAGGIKRVIKNVGEGVVSENKRYTTFNAENGRTYHWFTATVVHGRLEEDVMTVETESNWCRHLGTEAKYS